MASHMTREFNLITFDEATPSQDHKCGESDPTDGWLCPIHGDVSPWRRSTPAETGYGTKKKTDMSAINSLHDTLWHVEQGLSSVEKRLDARDSWLYETVAELQAKLRTLELSQERKYEEVKREIHEATEKQLRLRDRDNWLAPSPLKTCTASSNTRLSWFTNRNASKNKGISHADKDEDELWTTLEKIDQLEGKRIQEQTPFPFHKQHHTLQ